MRRIARDGAGDRMSGSAENLGARLSYVGRDRYGFTNRSYREHTQLSRWVWFQLYVGTFLLVWLAVIKAIGAIL